MEISQRTATLGDAALLLEWRNNPVVRKFSQHSGPISLENHMIWFSSRLETVHSEPFTLFLADHKIIGMTRLDYLPGFDNSFAITILVDPNERGKGFGTKILNTTCESFFSACPRSILKAKVHQNNYASQKLFINADFSVQIPTGLFLNYEKSLKSSY